MNGYLKSTFALLIVLSYTLGPRALAKKKQHVHEHGYAKLGIAVDGKMVDFDLDTPAQGLYGFEHEAKSPEEKKAVAAAHAKFTTTTAAELFVFPGDLGCQVTKASVQKEGAAHGGHSDLAAQVQFTCAKAASGAMVNITLIKAFPGIKKIKAQILSGTKQAGAIITRPEQGVSL